MEVFSGFSATIESAGEDLVVGRIKRPSFFINPLPEFLDIDSSGSESIGQKSLVREKAYRGAGTRVDMVMIPDEECLDYRICSGRESRRREAGGKTRDLSLCDMRVSVIPTIHLRGFGVIGPDFQWS